MINDLELIETLYKDWVQHKNSAVPSLVARQASNNAKKIALANNIPNLIQEIRELRKAANRQIK